MKTMEQKNTETVTAFIEAFWNQTDLDCTDQFLSADYRELSSQSKEGLKQFAGKIVDAFPDKHYSVEEIIAQGEKVLVRMVVKVRIKECLWETRQRAIQSMYAVPSISCSRWQDC
jgi:predicted ester cyclase